MLVKLELFYQTEVLATVRYCSVLYPYFLLEILRFQKNIGLIKNSSKIISLINFQTNIFSINYAFVYRFVKIQPKCPLATDPPTKCPATVHRQYVHRGPSAICPSVHCVLIKLSICPVVCNFFGIS